MSTGPDPSPTPTVLLRVDEVCDRFEAEWRAGRRPDLAAYLGETWAAWGDELLPELLRIDIAYRRGRGEIPTPAEYIGRFPEGSARIDAVFEAITLSAGPGAGTTHTSHGPAPGESGPGGPTRLGRFIDLGVVGEGGMGRVHRALDTGLGREVAVKVVREDGALRPEFLRRFALERRITSQLQHPGIPPVFEAGTLPDGRPYYAMKLVSGRTLAELLRGDAPPTDGSARLLGVFEQVAQTLAYAHDRRVVHRDLKPSNVMVGAFGEVQVMDWGLAKVLGGGGEADARPVGAGAGTAVDEEPTDLSLDGSVIGTPAFMAPEQARGELGRIDERTDVFALGSILCAILTGAPAYRGGSSKEIHQRAARCDLADAHARLGACGADGDLVALARRCLSPEPADRPAGAGEVAAAIAAHLAAVGDRLRRAELDGALARAEAEQEARRRELADRLVRQERGRRRAVAALAAALAAIALTAVAAALLVDASRRREKVARLAESAALERTRAARRQEADALERSQISLARLEVERALTHFAQGETHPGLLWLARALADAPPRAVDLQQVIRRNLAAWGSLFHRPVRRIDNRAPITAAAFSPDGHAILTASSDGHARLLDPATGSLLLPPMRHADAAGAAPVRMALFSADGRTILTVGDDTFRTWDAATGRPRHEEIRAGGGIIAAALSADGSLVLTGGYDRAAQLWDGPTGRPRGEPVRHAAPVTTVAFSPDATRAFSGGNTCPVQYLWGVGPDGPTYPRPVDFLNATCSQFSPDGLLVLLGNLNGVATLWQSDGGGRVGMPMAHEAPVDVAAFSPDGRAILTGAQDGKVRIWDTGGRVLRGPPAPGGVAGSWGGSPADRSLLTHAQGVKSAQWRADGRAYLTTGWDRTARLWDAALNPLGGPIAFAGNALPARLSPDGRTILTADEMDAGLRLWDAGIAQPAALDWAEPDRELNVAAYRPDRRAVLAFGRGRVIERSAADGELIRTLDLPQAESIAAAFSPDASALLLIGPWVQAGDQSIGLYDTTTGEPMGPPIRLPFRPNKAWFHGDGRRILFASEGEARLWDVPAACLSGRALSHAPGSTLRTAAFSPDGQTVATGGTDGIVRFWDTTTGAPAGPGLPQTENVSSLAYSPGGGTLVVGTEGGIATAIDLRTGRPIGRPMRHEGNVWAAAVSPDGQMLLTALATGGRTAHLWHLPTGMPIGTRPLLSHHSWHPSVAFGNDSRALLVAGLGVHVRVPPAPAQGPPARLLRWAEDLTGMVLTEDGATRPIDAAEGEARRRSAGNPGAPPAAGPG